jgi:2-dehydropantoate 2-reductase
MEVIIGAGAVGGTLAALLLRAGRKVVFVVPPDRAKHYRDSATLHLSRVNGKSWQFPAPPVHTDLAGLHPQHVYLAVKYRDLAVVTAQLERDLAPGIPIFSCLNGISAVPYLQSHLPNNPVQHLTILYNAACIAPMRYVLTTRPMALLEGDEPELRRALGKAGLRLGRGGVEAARGKLLINLNNAICALTNKTFGDMLKEFPLKQAFTLTLDEAVRTLQDAEMRFKLPVPVPYPVYRWIGLHTGALPYWLGRLSGSLSTQAYPSMVADIHAGKSTEVDELNGAIVDIGRQHHLPTPVNTRIVELVKDLERQQPPHYLTTAELLRQLQAAAHR